MLGVISLRFPFTLPCYSLFLVLKSDGYQIIRCSFGQCLPRQLDEYSIWRVCLRFFGPDFFPCHEDLPPYQIEIFDNRQSCLGLGIDLESSFFF